MSDHQSNETGILTSTKREESVFYDSMRYFWHNIWIGFKKFYLLILIFILVITSSVYIYGDKSYVPRYASSITFLAKPLISNQSTKKSEVFSYNNNIVMGSQLSVTFPLIFESGILKEIIQNELGTNIDATIDARAVADTNYFVITVVSDTPQNAKTMADSLMKNFPKVSEVVLGDIKTEIKIPSNLPTAPCNANEKWNLTFYAFAISVVLSVLLLCVYAANRKNVCSKDDVKYVLNQPYICEIPFIKEKKTSTNRFKSIIKSRGFTESLRILKNRIFGIITDKNYKTIGIVSTKNNEGKTTLAAGLAKILSGKTESTILVTFDYAVTPHIKRSFRQKDIPTIVLVKKCATYKAAQPVAGIEKLFDNVDLLVLPSKIISDKQKLAEIFETLNENYAYTIIDVVPGDSYSEAVSLINFCDAYIPVIRSDYVPTNRIKNTLDYFSYSKAHNLGVVLNGVSATYNSYGRYSNYGKYRKYTQGYNYYSYGMYGEETNK